MLSLTNVTGVCSAIKLFSRWHVSNVHYSGPDCRLTVMSRSHVSVTRPHHSSWQAPSLRVTVTKWGPGAWQSSRHRKLDSLPPFLHDEEVSLPISAPLYGDSQCLVTKWGKVYDDIDRELTRHLQAVTRCDTQHSGLQTLLWRGEQINISSISNPFFSLNNKSGNKHDTEISTNPSGTLISMLSVRVPGNNYRRCCLSPLSLP